MSENRNLSTNILQMYEELKTMKEIVLGLTSPHNIVTAEEKDKLRQSLLTTDWKFLPGIKDERYNKFYLLSTADEDITSLGQELLDELILALNLFDISKNVLSNKKQLMLTTLYLSGIRGIAYQNTDFALYHDGGYFAGNMKFIKDTNEFDFSVLAGYLEPQKTYSLRSIIKELCPKYKYVLEYVPDEKE